MKRLKQYFALLAILLLTEPVFSQALPKLQADSWKEAESFVQKKEWRKAEQSFRKIFAAERDYGNKTLCQYKIAFCREQSGKKNLACQQYEALISDLSAFRNSPDAVRMASIRLHALLLEDANTSSRRQRLIQDFLQRFPSADKEAGKLCFAEANYQLSQNREKEALSFYQMASQKGVQEATPILSLLSTSKSKPIDKADLQNISILEKHIRSFLFPSGKFFPAVRMDGRPNALS